MPENEKPELPPVTNPRICVKHSVSFKNSKTELTPDLVAQQCHLQWRRLRQQDAICTLTELGWSLEETDNGLRCLVARSVRGQL